MDCRVGDGRCLTEKRGWVSTNGEVFLFQGLRYTALCSASGSFVPAGHAYALRDAVFLDSGGWVNWNVRGWIRAFLDSFSNLAPSPPLFTRNALVYRAFLSLFHSLGPTSSHLSRSPSPFLLFHAPRPRHLHRPFTSHAPPFLIVLPYLSASFNNLPRPLSSSDNTPGDPATIPFLRPRTPTKSNPPLSGRSNLRREVTSDFQPRCGGGKYLLGKHPRGF